MSTPKTVTTRFLVISDTHNFQFGDAEKASGVFAHPPPKADVLLHCGDLSYVGGLASYAKSLRMLGSIDAELKLVIAGNHDKSLDQEYFKSHLSENDDPDEHEKAMEMWKGQMAKDAGVTYLEEGMSTFNLKSGAKFTIYTSPYQPEFYDWAFPYNRDQDRYNTAAQAALGVTSIAENPIPDFPAVDIMMTHGPPKGILDWTAREPLGVGCENLLRAVGRARPRMHCFGHIHEGHGATMVKWDEGFDASMKQLGLKVVKQKKDESVCYPKPVKRKVEFGKETLMVNAAIMNVQYRPVNSPWLVDLELPLEMELPSEMEWEPSR